jgi:hypothetical protein
MTAVLPYVMDLAGPALLLASMLLLSPRWRHHHDRTA